MPDIFDTAETVVLPTTQITSSPATASSSSSASFGFTGATGEFAFSGYEYRLDYANWIGASAPPVSFTNLQNGKHYFQVRSLDIRGNKDASPPTFEWTVAEIPTVAFATGPLAGASGITASSVSTYIAVTGTANITGSYFEVSLNDQGWSRFPGGRTGVTIASIGTGVHNLCCRHASSRESVSSIVCRTFTVTSP